MSTTKKQSYIALFIGLSILYALIGHQHTYSYDWTKKFTSGYSWDDTFVGRELKFSHQNWLRYLAGVKRNNERYNTPYYQPKDYKKRKYFMLIEQAILALSPIATFVFFILMRRRTGRAIWNTTGKIKRKVISAAKTTHEKI